MVKCTTCLIYSEAPIGSYVKHLVSLMDCSGSCSGSFWQVWQVLVGSCVPQWECAELVCMLVPS